MVTSSDGGKIQIYQRGSGKVTDKKIVKDLINTTPKSHKSAMSVLRCADRYVHRKGWFSSTTSRMKSLQSSIYSLEKSLVEESYIPETAFFDGETVKYLFNYLSKISDAYPNWQDEYKELNKFIPQIY